MKNRGELIESLIVSYVDFGGSYPAGCEGPPEGEGSCPVCGARGDPRCFEQYGLQLPQDDLEDEDGD